MKPSHVTIKDLEEEIRLLRVGIGNQTAAMIELQQDYAEKTALLADSRAAVSRLEREMVQQHQYNAQAYETLAILVRKMPYAQQIFGSQIELVRKEES